MCNCANKLTGAQAKEVWAKHTAGFNDDLIAAQMQIKRSCVRDVISKGDPMLHPTLVAMAEEMKPKKTTKVITPEPEV